MIGIKGKEVTANGGWLHRKGDSVAFTACTLLAGWGKMPGTPTLDLSPLTAWTDGVSTLLLLYNRAIGGLGKMTIKLTASAYASLQEMGGVTYLNQAGYTVTK